MALTRREKEQIVAELAAKFSRAKSFVFAQFAGVPVKDLEALRRQARKEEVEIAVAKKTLFKRAAEEARLEGVDPVSLPESVMAIFGFADEVAPAKLIAAFAKTHEAVKLLSGMLEGKARSGAEMVALSKLPGKQELLLKLVCTMNAPVSGFVNVLAGNLRGLVTALSAIQKQKTV